MDKSHLFIGNRAKGLIIVFLLQVLCLNCSKVFGQEVLSGQQELVTSPIKTSEISCDNTIDNVLNILKKKQYFVVGQDEIGNTTYPNLRLNNDYINEYYKNYPKDKPLAMFIHLSGYLNGIRYDFMKSSQLIADLSAQIMSSCDRIGLIIFLAPIYHDQDSVVVGYFPDNTAKVFECPPTASYFILPRDWGVECNEKG